MKQIIQNLKNGDTILEEVPTPQIKSGQILIQTKRSLVSLGTEKMLVEFGKSNLISKACKQPDKVKMVLDKIKAEGLIPTLEAVFKKLDQPLPLGYCNVGKVIGIGEGVSSFQIGDRVASNGAHAEVVSIPENLVAKIPDAVSDDEAAFTVISSIGLQGIRLLNPTLGETVVVIGLGLIGLITAQLLHANGCKVIGFDFDQTKVELARTKGIDAVNIAKGTDPVKYAMSKTDNIGVDGVIITASTKSNDVISQAANMSRKRGRIILVGVIGLNISRAEFYEKELSFQVSCSYGPGRYDSKYEQKGIDYPLPFVRWTEKRNFEAILSAIENKQLDVNPLITEKVKLENYLEIYGDMKKANSIASLIEYPENVNLSSIVQIKSKDFSKSKAVMAVVGAGNFVKMTMLPFLKQSNANIKYIVSAGGVSGTSEAKKADIAFSSSDYNEILKDNELDAVLITTRHNLHSKMILDALKAGKHVFVEKPLTIVEKELDDIIKAYEKSDKTLTVGFNRRFSPHIEKMKNLLGDKPSCMNIIATMNAGAIPADVWVHDMNIGGGRIIGEACHFIDLVTYLTDSKVKSVSMSAMGKNPSENTDNAIITLKYENGSQAVINYFSNGHKAYSKERIEVYSQEKILILDNFISLKAYGYKGFSKMKTKLDKGHKTQFKLFKQNLEKGGKALIPFDEIINTSKASFAAIKSLKENKWINVE